MKRSDIGLIRLMNQHIAGTRLKTAGEIAAWMGALQAQDYPMSKWAMGVRLPGTTDTFIEAAIGRGEVIRTHILRPTWHIVPAEDIYWMLELSAPQISALLSASNKALELTESVFAKSNGVIEKALGFHGYLTREELAAELETAHIPTGDTRMSHLLFQAEMEGIICSGPEKGHKPTYALLAERIPKTRTLTRDEALAELARRYFTSHCPATVHDFAWWSGLSLADARHAVEMNRSRFISEQIEGKTYWLPESFVLPEQEPETVHLLPAFDEFLISYRDRTATLASEHQKEAMTVNGIFKPVIVIGGQATGLWKRTVKKDKVTVETWFFRPHTPEEKRLIEREAEKFGRFLGKTAAVDGLR